MWIKTVLGILATNIIFQPITKAEPAIEITTHWKAPLLQGSHAAKSIPHFIEMPNIDTSKLAQIARHNAQILRHYKLMKHHSNSHHYSPYFARPQTVYLPPAKAGPNNYLTSSSNIAQTVVPFNFIKHPSVSSSVGSFGGVQDFNRFKPFNSFYQTTPKLPTTIMVTNAFGSKYSLQPSSDIQVIRDISYTAPAKSGDVVRSQIFGEYNPGVTRPAPQQIFSSTLPPSVYSQFTQPPSKWLPQLLSVPVFPAAKFQVHPTLSTNPETDWSPSHAPLLHENRHFPQPNNYINQNSPTNHFLNSSDSEEYNSDSGHDTRSQFLPPIPTNALHLFFPHINNEQNKDFKTSEAAKQEFNPNDPIKTDFSQNLVPPPPFTYTINPPFRTTTTSTTTSTTLTPPPPPVPHPQTVLRDLFGNNTYYSTFNHNLGSQHENSADDILKTPESHYKFYSLPEKTEEKPATPIKNSVGTVSHFQQNSYQQIYRPTEENHYRDHQSKFGQKEKDFLPTPNHVENNIEHNFFTIEDAITVAPFNTFNFQKVNNEEKRKPQQPSQQNFNENYYFSTVKYPKANEEEKLETTTEYLKTKINIINYGDRDKTTSSPAPTLAASVDPPSSPSPDPEIKIRLPPQSGGRQRIKHPSKRRRTTTTASPSVQSIPERQNSYRNKPTVTPTSDRIRPQFRKPSRIPPNHNPNPTISTAVEPVSVNSVSGIDQQHREKPTIQWHPEIQTTGVTITPEIDVFRDHQEEVNPIITNSPYSTIVTNQETTAPAKTTELHKKENADGDPTQTSSVNPLISAELPNPNNRVRSRQKLITKIRRPLIRTTLPPPENFENRDSNNILQEISEEATTTVKSLIEANKSTTHLRPIGKYQRKNRPRFSVKDYKQRLQETSPTSTEPTATTLRSTSSINRLRFPTRKRLLPSLNLKNAATTTPTTSDKSEPPEVSASPVTSSTTERLTVNHRFKPRNQLESTTASNLGQGSSYSRTTRKNTRRPYSSRTTNRDGENNQLPSSTTEFSIATNSRRPSKVESESANDLRNITIETKTENPIEVVTNNGKLESAIMKIAKDNYRHQNPSLLGLETSASSATVAPLSPGVGSITASAGPGALAPEVDISEHQDETVNKRKKNSTKQSEEVAKLTNLGSSYKFNAINANIISRRIPGYFTIATEDPILPIQAFFPTIYQKPNASVIMSMT